MELFCCLFCAQLIAMGKNSSELFPAVVKNVASKNIEVGLHEKYSNNMFILYIVSNG